MVGVGRHIQVVFKKNHVLGGDLLPQLCCETRRMDVLPFINLCKLLSRGPRYSFSSE